jgi:hypothetical protein
MKSAAKAIGSGCTKPWAHIYGRDPARHRRSVVRRRRLHGVPVASLSEVSEAQPVRRELTNDARGDRGVDRLDIALMLILTVLASVLGAVALWIGLR